MKIALVGYGKMGHEIEKIALERGHEIVCIIDQNQENKFDSDAFESADIVIEFTSPDSALQNYKNAFAHNKPVVSGTTGWLEHIDEIKLACEKEGQTFFYASNFSLGMNIFFALNNYLSTIMNRFEEYDVRVEETHHIHKLDAPSGTAITITEDILKNIDRKEDWVLIKEGVDSHVSDTSIAVTAFREDEVPGIHTVIYESEADKIKITHNAKNRRGFAMGALLAAEFVKDKKGFFGMKDLLKF